MTVGMASRPAAEQALEEFLAAAAQAPSALLVDGEAGIGKTTVLRSGLARARARGLHALSARAVEAESVLAYESLADLLADVDTNAWTCWRWPRSTMSACAKSDKKDGDG